MSEVEGLSFPWTEWSTFAVFNWSLLGFYSNALHPHEILLYWNITLTMVGQTQSYVRTKPVVILTTRMWRWAIFLLPSPLLIQLSPPLLLSPPPLLLLLQSSPLLQDLLLLQSLRDHPPPAPPGQMIEGFREVNLSQKKRKFRFASFLKIGLSIFVCICWRLVWKYFHFRELAFIKNDRRAIDEASFPRNLINYSNSSKCIHYLLNRNVINYKLISFTSD